MTSRLADLLTEGLAPLGWRRDPASAGWAHDALGMSLRLVSAGCLRMEHAASGRRWVVRSRCRVPESIAGDLVARLYVAAKTLSPQEPTQ